jgi:Domain of unknown function (DUF4375)
MVAADHRQLGSLLRRLIALRPRAREAGELKSRLEHRLMRITLAGGLRAVDRAIAEVSARGRELAPIERKGTRRTWREPLANGRRTLEIRVVANRHYRSTLVRYETVHPLRLSPRQRAVHALQQAFYARYMAVGARAYRRPAPRLSPDDRLVLLIGELEADVNNGGFAQYLDNKGRRRAGAALAALRTVGARRTARMLEQALAGPSASQLSALDDRFYAVPEDLAVLTVRHVGLSSEEHEPVTRESLFR